MWQILLLATNHCKILKRYLLQKDKMYNYGGLSENGYEKYNLDFILQMLIFHSIFVENQWNFLKLTTENLWIESNLKIYRNYGIKFYASDWNLRAIINFMYAVIRGLITLKIKFWHNWYFKLIFVSLLNSFA